MSKPVVEVQVRGVAATGGGCAVFLGNEEKAFVIFVDQSVGAAIAMFKQGARRSALRMPLRANSPRLSAKSKAWSLCARALRPRKCLPWHSGLYFGIENSIPEDQEIPV